MGNAQSPPADPRFSSASRAFTPMELEDLKSLFVSLAAQSQSRGDYITLPVFQAYFHLHGPFGERLFDLITEKRKDQKLTFEDLVIAKATYEKGSGEEIEEFISQFLDVNGDGILGRSDMESVLSTLFENVFGDNLPEDYSSSHQDIARIFLDSANFSRSIEGHDEKSMLADLKSWFVAVPSVRKSLWSLLLPRDPGRPGFQVPSLLHGDNVDSNMIILKKEYAWHIGGALAEQEMEEWKLLYHTME